MIFSILIPQKGDVETLSMAYHDINYHLENAEMTLELRDDLIHFSFDCFQDMVKEADDPWIQMRGIHNFSPRFLEYLKVLVCYHCYSHILCIFTL